MSEVRTDFLFRISIQVGGTPAMIGRTPFGERRIARIGGGTVEGPKVNGIIQSGGGDWILLRADGAMQLDVRLTIETDDNALIYMTYRGVRHGPPDVMDRVNRGEPVDPAAYYFRTAPFFETGSEKYGWLNRIVAVGIGSRVPEGPIYDVFQVL